MNSTEETSGDRIEHHADEEASVNDGRIHVEEGPVGVYIVREMYGKSKYADGETWYDWHEDERFHIPADQVRPLVDGLKDVYLEQMLESVKQLEELDEALSQ